MADRPDTPQAPSASSTEETSGEPAPAKAPSSESLSQSAKVYYSLFRLADTLVMSNMGNFVQVYYTIVWKVRPLWLVFVQPMLKLFDVVTDPLVGQLSDNTRSKMGRRRPWVLFGGLAMAVMFWMYWSPHYVLFWIAEPSPKQILVFYIVFYLAYYTTHTISVVPYNALGAELSSDQDERTKIFALRHLIGAPGMWLGTLTYVLATRSFFESEKQGMPVAVAFISVVIVICSILTFMKTKENPDLQTRPKMKMTDAFKVTITNRPFILMCASSFFFHAGYLFMLQFSSYLIIYSVFGGDREPYSVLISEAALLMVVMAFAANFAIRRYALSFDKKKCFMIFASVGFLIPLTTLIAFNPEHPRMFLLLKLVAAIGLTNMDIMPFAIMADLADLDEVKSGRRREGAFAGIYNSIYKAGLLLSPVFTNIFLEVAGFDVNLEQQTDQTVFNLRIIMFIFLLFMMTVSFLFAVLYPIRRADVDAARAELTRRRESGGAGAP